MLLLTSAIVSLDEAKRIAPLKSPSSNFAATKAAKFSRETLGTLLVNLLGTLWGGSGSASSLIIELTWDVKLLQCTPLLCTLRQQEAKRSRRSHNDSFLRDTTWSLINGSNHWILCQPDQVSKTDTMARGTRGPICSNQ